MINPYTNALETIPISVFYKWPKLGYKQDYQSLSPKYPILTAPILFPRDTTFPVIPMYPHKTYIQVLDFILTSASSTRSLAKKLSLPSQWLILPPATYLSIPPGKIVYHSNSSKYSFILPPPCLQELHITG